MKPYDFYRSLLLSTIILDDQGMNYLVIADRYSNWPIVNRAQDGSKGLMGCYKGYLWLVESEMNYLLMEARVCCSYHEVILFDWGVHHRLSSVAFPHSNCRAEVGVKTIKQLITNNVGPRGNLNVDKTQKMILQYWNSPDKDLLQRVYLAHLLETSFQFYQVNINPTQYGEKILTNQGGGSVETSSHGHPNKCS